MPSPGVDWPPGHAPSGADIHVVNTARVPASPDVVWARLVRPDRWREIYPNALRVRHVVGPWPEVGPGSVFTWITFGATVRTEITEYVAEERLAWTGSGAGARGHHAWVLIPDGNGTLVHTEETQRGHASRLLRPVLRPAMSRMHDRWIRGLGR